MNTKTTRFFASVRQIAALGVICMLLFTVASCKSEDEFDLSSLHCIPPDGGWTVILYPKPGLTDCPTESPRIKDLVRAHNVTFRRTFPEAISPVDQQTFILAGGVYNCNIRRARRAVRAFLATGLFGDIWIISDDRKPGR